MYQTPKDCRHEFKILALKRYSENARRGKFTARELGIPESTLRGWKNRLMSEVQKDVLPEKKGKRGYYKERNPGDFYLNLPTESEKGIENE